MGVSTHEQSDHAQTLQMPTPRTHEPSAKRLILGSVTIDEPEWKLVQHSQYGVLDRDGGKCIEPAGPVPCEAIADSADPHALAYTIPVTPNTYAVLQDEGYDASLPPDLDIEVDAIDDDGDVHKVSGFTADSPLLPHMEEVQLLKSARQLVLKVEQVTVEELQQAIDEFVERDVLNFTSHDDTLAAIQVQPAYFRRIFRLSNAAQLHLLRSHAVYRTICAEPLRAAEATDYLERLRQQYEVDSIHAADFFERMFPDKPRADAALHSALCDLFLMIFAPSIYLTRCVTRTKFSEEDSLQTNQHYIHVADSGAHSFWSNTTSPVFNGKRGVGLVLSSASPFRDVVDSTEHVYKTQLRNRYLLLEAKLGDRQIFLHVVYAPVKPARRGEFFRSLPTRFDFGAAEDFKEGCGPMHLAVGDFNTTMDNFLDQTSPSLPQPGTGREELCDWLNALGLIDA
ncbi:unnamed protein product [Phytophthora lilii]|uniref:Unnamed protein product n=1 Tax=Phytophthora lilii TaxID=2077276 RepID=A0A9W6X4H3_9STRA|nr:unnamed protein product [Phytophthora lilii]